MQIHVNGKAIDCPDGSTVADLMARLETPEMGTAVARNDAVVRKAQYAETVLHENDRLEIIHAVAGG